MQELKILQKIYDMTIYGNECLKYFPKHEKFLMAADIRKSMHRMRRLTIRANKRYQKKAILYELDEELDVLRGDLRLAVDQNLRYLSLKKYENWSKMLDEIGRMLGGWMKSAIK